MKTLNSYDFENMLQDEYFSGNEVDEINRDIESRIINDAGFAEQYESWITGSSYTTWHDYYKEKEAEEEEEWENSVPEEDDEEDDDGLTDYTEDE
jgi:hypothetical protein